MKDKFSLFFFVSSFITVSAQTQKPNVIFILTDDHRWDALGYAGNKIIRTPEMDRLAKEGVYFKNAFVTTPISAASRASILTGMYERTHGYTFEQGQIKAPFINNSYPAMLKKAGYTTAFFGKFGVDYTHLDSLFDAYDNYDRNGKFKDYRGYFYKTLGKDTVHLTRYTGQQAIDFIEQCPEGKPFVLSLSFSAPHAHDPAPGQYFWQKEVDTFYNDVVIPSPLISDEKYFNDLPLYVRTGENRTRWNWRFDTPEKYQKSIKGYYRMISGIDLEIGKIRKTLQAKGIANNTIIILMGDNGYFEGERQLAGKWLMYENSLRVPLIIYDPRYKRHYEIEEMALNIDIAPTIAEITAVPVSNFWHGKSLAGFSSGKNPLKDRKDFICEHLWETKIIAPSEGLRTKKWKYFRYRNDKEHEELYDLEKDPLEINNLAKKAGYEKILTKMRNEFEQKSSQLKQQQNFMLTNS